MYMFIHTEGEHYELWVHITPNFGLQSENRNCMDAWFHAY